MKAELNDRQSIPMTTAMRKQLRRVALDYDVSPGLLGRALIAAGLANTDSAAVAAQIKLEADAAKRRWSEAGRVAVETRHKKNKNKQEDEQ